MLAIRNHFIALGRWLGAQGIERFAPYVGLLLVLLLTHSLAQLTWSLLPPPPAADPLPLPLPGASPDSGGQRIEPARIVAWQLFGPDRPARGPSAPPPQAPETTLNLTLRGVVFSPDPRLARAIIGSAGKEAQYAVGMALPGNAELREIHPDRVILLHGGRYETLRLPREAASQTQVARTPPPLSPASAQPSLRALRDNLLANPLTLPDLVRINPVAQAGGFVGFRLAPGRNRALLGQFGLREGDVVTAVNGTRLDSPTKGLEVLNELRSAEQITLTVLRAGAEESVTLSVQ